MKNYELNLENIGTDVYTLMSRGHHNFDEFMELVNKEFPSWKLKNPVHLYFKNVFGRFIECDKLVKGSFPATYVDECLR